MKNLKRIPNFKNEEEEFEFWATHDSSDYVDMSKAKKAIFPNLKPTSLSVPIRFPVSLIQRLKYVAHRKSVPYQSLVKIYLEKCVQQELHRKT